MAGPRKKKPLMVPQGKGRHQRRSTIDQAIDLIDVYHRFQNAQKR